MIELTDNQVEEVENFFTKVKSKGPVQNLNQWDGFITGWVSIPENKSRTDVMETMLGKNDKNIWKTADYAAFEKNSLINLECLTQVFEDPKYDFSPTFLDEPEMEIKDVVDWCQGYIYAINIYKKYKRQLTGKNKKYWEEIEAVVKGTPDVEVAPDHEDYYPCVVGNISFYVDELYVAWNRYQNTDDDNSFIIHKDSDEFKKSPHGIAEKYINKYRTEHSIINEAGLDGFFAAIASSPEMIKPSDWLPAIWGGEEFSPEWKSEKEFMEFFQNVTSIYNATNDVLRNDPENFEPLFLTPDNNVSLIIGALPWCNGYMRGVSLQAELWEDLPEELEEYLQSIALLGSGKLITETGEAKVSREEEESLMQHAKEGIPELFVHWHNQMLDFMDTPKPFVREQKKVGRNAPCTCGSGKKFKKCCGK